MNAAGMTITYRIDLNAPQNVLWIGTLLVQGDDSAHKIVAELYRGREKHNPADDVTALGVFVRSDGFAVALGGEIAGNTVTITLDGACYAVAGPCYLSIVLNDQGGERTVLKAAGRVDQDENNGYIDETVYTSFDALVQAAVNAYLAGPYVSTVNGQSGDVTLDAEAVGALPASTKIPGKTSDLTNDSGYITKAVSDLTYYYLKSDTYTREEINQRISAIPKFGIAVVNTLPTNNISETTIYLTGGGISGNLYTEYIWANGAWEILGSQRVDLSGYATETWVTGQLGSYLKASELASAINTALAQAAASGEFDGKDGVSATHSWDGTVLTITSASGSSSAELKGEKGDDSDISAVSVRRHGAVGDGTTDDTAAFRAALAANREVYVPGGTYKLSSELTIGRNCGLILAQDAVLNFAQTTGNCISMRASASIRGNHALVKVPYEFTGRVVNIYAGLDESIVAVPPFTAWGPMWTVARYITDLHIAKLDYRGVAQSVDGTCSGTAVYLGASREDALPFLWAVDLTRLRISGAFSYGIHMDTLKVGMDAWIHQTRISAFVDGAEIGVYAKDSTLSYLDVMVIPRRALTTDNVYVPYAKHGIYLDGCTDVDMSGSRVMDWNSMYTLWAEGNMYQHIALIGDCHGAIINSHYYYSMPGYDIRSLIYTDNAENLETITIIQEPITRWFKPLGREPFFFNGDHEKRLLLKEELDEFVVTERKPNFDDKLSKAIDTDGTVFNGTGYIRYGNYWRGDTGALANSTNYGCTGFIAVTRGSVIRTSALYVTETDTQCGVVLYDVNFNRLMHVDATKMLSNAASYYLSGYKRTDEGIEFTVNQPSALAYLTISFRRADIGELPVISVNEPLTFSPHGYLSENILVKAESIDGLPESYTKSEIDAIMGNYVADIAAIVGGDA